MFSVQSLHGQWTSESFGQYLALNPPQHDVDFYFPDMKHQYIACLVKNLKNPIPDSCCVMATKMETNTGFIIFKRFQQSTLKTSSSTIEPKLQSQSQQPEIETGTKQEENETKNLQSIEEPVTVESVQKPPVEQQQPPEPEMKTVLYPETLFFQFEGYSGYGTITGKDKDGFEYLYKGKFENGVLVDGYCLRNDKKHCFGSFDSNGMLHGDGQVYKDVDKKQLLHKGIFQHGRLVDGVVVTENSSKPHFCFGKWAAETSTSTLKMLGIGEIYEDLEKTKLLQKGIFENGILKYGYANDRIGVFHKDGLEKGCYLYNGKSYVGFFKDSRLEGLGKIYVDEEHSKLQSFGLFKHDKLLSGSEQFTSLIQEDKLSKGMWARKNWMNTLEVMLQDPVAFWNGQWI